MQTHDSIVDYPFMQSPYPGPYGHDGYYPAAQQQQPQIPHHQMVAEQPMHIPFLDPAAQNGHGLLTIPVVPQPKRFQMQGYDDEYETAMTPDFMSCRRRVDFATFASYKSHPTAVARRNERERNRVKHINSTFTTLKQHLPCSQKNKKMSKVDTLRTAIKYIRHLQTILDSQESDIIEAISPKKKTGKNNDSSPCEKSKVQNTDSSTSPAPCSVTSSQSNRSPDASPSIDEHLSDEDGSEGEFIPWL